VKENYERSTLGMKFSIQVKVLSIEKTENLYKDTIVQLHSSLGLKTIEQDKEVQWYL
jgi:hypothetical protein